jgi:hypothetical protein
MGRRAATVAEALGRQVASVRRAAVALEDLRAGDLWAEDLRGHTVLHLQAALDRRRAVLVVRRAVLVVRRAVLVVPRWGR